MQSMDSEKPRVGCYSWVVLMLLLLMYVLNQWDRYLLNYLFAVAINGDNYNPNGTSPTDGCPTGDGSVCNVQSDETEIVCWDDSATAAQRCEGVDWANCEQCTDCLIANDAEKYAMKYGACISTAEYGVLVSFGFVAFFSIASLFGGRCADLFNRRTVLAIALMCWSAATLGQGASGNYSQVLASRLGIGLFEGFFIPSAYSLISDYFTQEMLGTANGIFAFGVYVGGGLSSLSIVIAKAAGWRITTYIAAALGGGLSVIFCLVVREPTRGGMNAKKVQDEEAEETGIAAAEPAPEIEKMSTVTALKTVFSDVCVVCLIIAATLRFIGGFSIGAFLPLFYKRQFEDYNDEYSILNAAVISVGGALSSFLGGFIADRWSRTQIKARAWVPAIGSLLGFFPFVGVLYASNFYVSIVCLFFEYLFAECWFGPAISIIQLRIPPAARGVGIALYLFIGQMIGNIAPVVLGAIDDESVETVQIALLVAVAFSYGSCALMFFVVGTLMGTPPGANCGREAEPLLDDNQKLSTDFKVDV